MKKIVTVLLICFVLAVLDNAFVPFFAIRGCYPSLLLVFALCYSIVNGKWEGLWVGILSGLLQDVFFINGFGVHALINMIICTIAGEIGTNIFKEKSLVPVVSNLILSLLKGILILIVLYASGIYVNLDITAYSSLYNMIVSIIAYKLVYNLCQKEYMQRKWKF